MYEAPENIISQKDKKILFVGIGNVLRSDDGVGVYISRRIKDHDNISSITVETGIENYIGKINSINPDLLILVDCAEISSSPGDCRLLKAGQIEDNTFNTHNISLQRLTEFFRMPVYLLAIQPEKVDFGEKLSYIVKIKADDILKKINKKEVHHG
ncbi:MAG TPA: hydrogenase maturation protease [Bacteroidales bacterium]|nr:hydrogenase maturation protease [Bacteroidales bacterium]